jgi:hypothetical protein
MKICNQSIPMEICTQRIPLVTFRFGIHLEINCHNIIQIV